MIGIYFFSILFILSGVLHFVKPKFYLRITPLFLPQRLFLVYLSGVAEIIAGVLILFQKTREIAVYSIFAMLFVFLIVHINMLRGGKHAAGAPYVILILRLILQFVLMYWVLTIKNVT